MYAVLGVPDGNATVFRGDAIAAMVDLAEKICLFSNGLLFGKLARQHHAVIAGVAAIAQDVVDVLLSNRKGEGRKYRALRLIDGGNLFGLTWDEAAIEEVQL